MGGIIVVPILVEIGVNVHTAIASAMTSYIAAGLVGATIYFRTGHLDQQAAMPVCGLAIPTAFGASLSLDYIGDITVKAILYSLMVASSLFALVKTLREAEVCTVADVEGNKPIDEPLQTANVAKQADETENAGYPPPPLRPGILSEKKDSGLIQSMAERTERG